MRPRVVLTYGRFDHFGQGHALFLRQAAMLGDELIVGCQTDAFAGSAGTPCLQPYDTRRAMLEKCRYVSRVISETSLDQKRTDIVNYDVALLVMGHRDRGAFAHLEDVAQVQYIIRDIRAANQQNTGLTARAALAG